MKREAVFFLAFVMIMSLVTGCASTSSMSGKTPFEIIQENEIAISAAGGLAEVGICSTRTVVLAMDRAQTRGRDQLASRVESKLNDLKQAFLKEEGPADAGEINKLFSAATGHLKHLIVHGMAPKDFQTDSHDNLTTAWALMVAEPKKLANALAGQSYVSPHLYTRFLASETFAALDKEIKDFDAFKASRGGMVIAR